MKAFVIAFSLISLSPLTARAQNVQVGLSRDTIRVGDPFRAVIRISVPPGTTVVLPDSATPTEDIENAGRMRTQRDSTANGVAVLAAYPLTAWRTGPLTMPDLNVVLKMPNGDRNLAVHLPTVNVVSVLPADTTNIQPKPAKDVIGKNWLLWPWILLALLLITIAALAWWWWKRRKQPEMVDAPLPLIMPRDAALRELDRIAAMNLANEGLYKRHYTLVSEVLRRYMETTEPSWNGGLTTDELARMLRGNADVREPIAVLRNADMVKFANASSNADEATRDLDRARTFIATWPLPSTSPSEAEAEAAA